MLLRVYDILHASHDSYGLPGEYLLNGDILSIYEGKNFYPIAMEAREAPELSVCKVVYDKTLAKTTFSEGALALAWFQTNKKVVLVPHADNPKGAVSALATPVKKKKLVPTVLEIGDEF